MARMLLTTITRGRGGVIPDSARCNGVGHWLFIPCLGEGQQKTDNSNLSQDIFAIDTWGAVICFSEHGCKQMLTILPTIWRPCFTIKLSMVCRSLRHMVGNTVRLPVSESSKINTQSFFLFQTVCSCKTQVIAEKNRFPCLR